MTATFEAVHAPQKEFVMLPAGGHFAAFTHPEEFLKEMNARVRPFALPPP
jgi:pimeloyl-ACP methyl ester carboxylesterase